MGFIKRSQYLHYGQKEDYKRIDLGSGIEEYPKAQVHSEMEYYFLPQKWVDSQRYDIRKTGKHTPHFSRFKNSGYFNGYGMGHFNRYSTSEAEYNVGVHPKGVAPPEYYTEEELGQNSVRSHFYEQSYKTRMNI